MGKGLRKGYIILIISIIFILLFSSLTILINLGVSSYKEFMLKDKIESNYIEVVKENIEVSNVYDEEDKEKEKADNEVDSEEFKNNLYNFKDDNLYGFKNSYGEVVIEPKYSRAENFSEGLGLISIDYKFGYIDTNENIVIENKYYWAESFKNGLAIVEFEDGSQGVIDKEGNELFITSEYNLIDIVGEYILASEKNSSDYLTGYLNKKGEKVGELKYSSIDEFKYGYARVSIDGEYGFINDKGEEVVPLVYSDIIEFSEGYAVLVDKGKNKIINTELKQVMIDNIDFMNIRNIITKGIIIGKDINESENVIFDKDLKELFRLPTNYSFQDVIKGDTIVFAYFNDYKDVLVFMDLNGKIKFEVNNAYISYENVHIKEDYFIIQESESKNGFGVIDTEANEVIPFKYSDIKVKGDFFICIEEGFFRDKIDIYYRNNKIASELKSDLINVEGEGVISIDENEETYYINKYGEKFLKHPEW